MFKYYVAKIYDSIRSFDKYIRDKDWGTDGDWGTPPYNDYVNRGVVFETDTYVSGTPNAWKFLEDDFEYRDGDFLIARCKHNFPITDITLDAGTLAQQVVEEAINVPFDGYYTSYKKIRLMTFGNDRMLIEIVVPTQSGIIKCWDVEGIHQDVSNPPNEIYLSDKKNVKYQNIDCLPFLSTPRSINRSIDPATLQINSASLEFEIYNKDTIISQIIYERINADEAMLWGDKVDLIGVDEKGIENLLYTGIISDISSDPMEMTYNIATSNIFEIMKTEIFSRELSDYTDQETGTPETIDLINQYRFPTLPDGTFLAEEYDDNGTMKRRIKYDGHVIDFVLGVFSIIFSTPTNAVGVAWITDSYMEFINYQSFLDIKSKLPIENYDFHFEFIEPLQEPFEFIKNQVFKPASIFPFIQNDGKLGLKFHEQPQSTAGLLTFNEDNIITINSKANDVSNYVNHILANYNYNYSEQKFYRKLYSMQSGSISKNKRLYPNEYPLTFDIEGTSQLSDSVQDLIVNEMVNKFFERYSTSLTRISLTTSLSFGESVKVGDYVIINHKTLIDWKGANAGKRGIYPVGGQPGDYAYFNQNDEWAGFIEGNSLGNSNYSGFKFLETSSRYINYELFNYTTSDYRSCKANHIRVDEWLVSQGY
jgi:hypothetical protein